MSEFHYTVRLSDRVRAVVEPEDEAEFHAAGDKTLVHMRVVELQLLKKDVEVE